MVTVRALHVLALLNTMNYSTVVDQSDFSIIIFHVYRDFYFISLKKESPVLLFQNDYLILNKMKKNQKGLIMNNFYHNLQVCMHTRGIPVGGGATFCGWPVNLCYTILVPLFVVRSHTIIQAVAILGWTTEGALGTQLSYLVAHSTHSLEQNLIWITM